MKILQSAKTKLNNKIELYGEDNTGNNVLIIGVFHGDEPQGKYLIEKYMKQSFNVRRSAKSQIPTRATYNTNNLLFLPCLNPDGMQNGIRTNSNGVDLNRNFPTKNWGEDTSAAGDNPSDYYGGKSAGSEIETQFVINILNKYKPKVILTLHAPYKVVNYDGPAKGIAQGISKIVGYPIEASIGYPTPGSFGTYCGIERNIPTITLELDEKIPVVQLEQPVFGIFDYLKN